MEKICLDEDCSGCGACSNVCPLGCIELKENKYGEKHPIINNELCVNCKKCQSVCPQNNNEHGNNLSYKCFAASSSLLDAIDCASGGVAYSLYYYFIRKYQNGLCVGVLFDDEITPVYVLTRDYNIIKRFRGSKYVQANDAGIYSKVGQALKDGHEVLFIGTPCQVLGCINYCDQKAISREKLYLVDLLCHGVAPNVYLKEYLEHIKDKIHINKIEDITFRSNRKHRDFHMVITSYRKNKRLIVNNFADEDPYYLSFLSSGLSLRNSCYRCKFSTCNRYGDLTIGDFIGLDISKLEKDKYSVVLVNTGRGDDLLNLISETTELIERNVQEAVRGGASLRKPYPKHKDSDDFKEYYSQYGFVRATDIILGQQLESNRKKLVLKHYIIKVLDYFSSKG